MSKITKRELLRRLEALEEWASGADNMLTELNHALPDPEYDAKCEAVADIEASLDRHCERLGLNKSELTGSDLCRAMLDKGFEYVMCLVGDECEESASNSEVVRVVCSHGADYFDDTTEDMWYFAIPINNQGEPLTASEVGL